MQDSLYINRCLELAALAGSQSGSNPKVGSVIVAAGKIIGEGYHKKYGGPHAEIEAFESVPASKKHLIEGATMYVSLEPCAHFGKTPPCADRIIAEKIKKVVICSKDPNQLVNGSGIQKLKENRIEVLAGIEGEKGDALIEPFVANLKKIPYIILKIVESSDGFIGSLSEKIWLSNQFSTTLSHKWRSEVDGIMIGSRTAILDNPSLNTRLWPGKNPVRVIWDANLVIPRSNHIYNEVANTIILNKIKDENVSENVTLVNVCKYSLKETLEVLFKMGINSILVEGGTATIRQFIEAGLWNEGRIITTKVPLQNQGYQELVKASKIEGKCVNETFLFGDRLRIVKKKE
ncbi:MAG TPA: bifunctional diaminohydroxyphosphoribosylaminopyrimidine deaminase/5-amino-6-(5-phosphoribosylamino)uracil reductase RibD [Saprospiraceae bacterium]|nr:bifunctional diaminohydroxyphosphoribosylaminopyrimidine deaminase/5-amino-6-(5-phosphoribosylamino)uracil reductase RibD [Saprospiraceae bacterium]